MTSVLDSNILSFRVSNSMWLHTGDVHSSSRITRDL